MVLNEKLSGTGKSSIAFRDLIEVGFGPLSLPDDIAKRSLNEGSSGGIAASGDFTACDKQVLIYAILDEPTGFDVDALKYIAKAIKSLTIRSVHDLITHYQRILGYITP